MGSRARYRGERRVMSDEYRGITSAGRAAYWMEDIRMTLTPTALFTDALLVAALAHAVFADLRRRRISNRITYPAMLAGMVLNAVLGGVPGLSDSALGLLAGLGLFLIPFALGAMGAGDVKLMAAIGAIKGPHFVLAVAVYASLAGGVLAVAYLIKERR